MMIRKSFRRSHVANPALLTFLSLLAWLLGASELATLFGGSFQQIPSLAATPTLRIDRAPLRTLQEDSSDWAFASVVVDPVRDEIVLQSRNRGTLLVYDRLDDAGTSTLPTKPKRIIEGPQSRVGNGGLYVDLLNGEIYSTTADQRYAMVVHANAPEGQNVPPLRVLSNVPKSVQMAVDEEAQEIFVPSQTPRDVVYVYAKDASGMDEPLRILQGPHTQLAYLFGIAVDSRSDLMYVANRGYGVNQWGSPSSPASITVYPLDASGDTAPVRVIQGPATRLNWPGNLYLDIQKQELFVTNTVDDSILVFRATATGNVPPIRVLKGGSTGLKTPYGVFVDQRHGELVVANWGNYTATVYARTAEGDSPPIRIIRGAPQGRQVPIFSHAPALAYDSNRHEILVPSCIIHTQIAFFDAGKLQTGGTPNRIVAGQETGLARDAHEMRYDPIHDEIVTVSPYANAIMIRGGGASGDEPPLRVIQGPQTQIDTLMNNSGILDVDPVHDEIFVSGRGAIRVFSRTAEGDVAPIRVINGPDTGLENAGTPLLGQLTVDPVHDLVAVSIGGRGNRQPGRILLFNRTDQGNVKPKAVISGPKTGIRNAPNLMFYPEKSLLLALMVGGDGYNPGDTARFLDLDPPSEIAIWSIDDQGDVPPRFLLGGPMSKMSGNEFTLNSDDKELIVGGPTSLRTYWFPDVF